MQSDPPAPHGSVYSHRGTRAVQRMVEHAPSTGSLALWVRHRDRDGAEPPLVTENDGTTISYGPAFERLPLPLQTGLVAHEVLHVALRHAPRYLELRHQIGDVDLELFNVCADAIVNSALSHLSWLDLGGGVLLEDLLAATLNIRQDAGKSLLEWDLERLYRALDDRGPSPRQPARKGDSRRSAGDQGTSPSAQGKAEQDQAAPVVPPDRRRDGPRAAKARALGRPGLPDLVPADAVSRPDIEAERSREWRERILRGHAGDGAHSMLRELLADLPKVRTPWEQILRTRLAHGLSLRPSLSWSRPSRSYIANRGRMGGGRRMPWEPGFSASKAVARLAVMVDVSGSIETRLLDRFACEIEAITRRMEAETLVVVGDDRVRHIGLFEPGRSSLREIRFQGGGGTDFSPLLMEAERWRPDIGVFLTDLDGPAEHRPAFPVLWAVPRAQAAMPHPFGRKLVLD
jgi:predicted metal-dependent peptidase